MKTRQFILVGIGAIALGLTACSPKAAEPAVATAVRTTPTTAAAPPMAGMDMTTPAVAAGPVPGVGTVTAIDAKAGTLTLKHEAIPAVHWDAMSMQFTADPALLIGVKAGDAVTFELKSAAEPTIVTKIAKK